MKNFIVNKNSARIKTMNERNNKKAFTLAEVLITLMVIGVLAMTTIPSLLQVWEERETVTKLKKTYSILQEAYKLTEIEDGPPDTWGISATNPIGNMKNHLRILKECPGNTEGCSYMGYYKYMTGTDADINVNSTKKFVLPDNTTIIPSPSIYKNCDHTGTLVNGNPMCVWLYIDLNGAKAPNQYGRDLFAFSLTKVGILPFGGPSTAEKPTTFNHNNRCKNSSYNGQSCARWVIERGNMDYLHKDTTW